MKRYIFLFVAICLMTLVGCVGRNDAPETRVPAPVDTPAETPTDTLGETYEETLPETPQETASDTVPETETDAASETEAITGPAETEEETVVRYETVQNPVVDTANDPWVVEHNGHYYYCRSFWFYVSGIIVTELESPYALTNEGGEVVFTATPDTPYSDEYWAPELHYINGEWYIYIAADDGKNENHRMYVLKGTSQDPTDPFEMVGQITDPSNKWAIDGTVLQVKDELYFVWSGWEGDTNVAQNIYIAHMSDPCTIDSERVLLSAPTYGWERVGEPYINEGPVALYHGEDIFLVYSASGSWTDDYCLGLLSLVGDDPMDPASWEKSDKPVFSARDNVAYGPGHCCFTTAVDGSIWMFYHANLQSGTGWEGRSGWIAPVTFAEDGTPIFGRPRKSVQFPVAVEKVTNP